MGRIDTRLTKVLQIVKTGTLIPIIVETARLPSSSDIQELNSEMSVKRVSKIANQIYGTADEQSIRVIASFNFVSTVFYDEPVNRFQFLTPSFSISKTDINIPISDVAQFIGATDLHDEEIMGKGIKVAVVDTGVNKNHPLLEGAVINQINIAKKNGAENADINDGNGHGTHVATTIGGRDRTIFSKLFGKQIRMHGVAPECEIIGIKVLDDEGSGQTSWVIEGMEAAVEAGADVINMSLGSMWDGAGLTPDSKVVDEIVFNHHILCAIAAGNSFANLAIGSPGGSHGALTVGSNAMKTPSPGIVSTFSSKGTTTDGRVKPDISAPGGNIVNIKETIYAGTSGALKEEAGEDYIGIMGTCLTGDSLVILDDGIPIPIKDLIEGDCVCSWNESDLKYYYVKRVISNGIKDVYSIELSGKIIKCTDNHPFLVCENEEYIWKEMKDLKINDKLVVLNSINDSDSNIISFKEAKKDIYNDFYVSLTEIGSRKITVNNGWYYNLRVNGYFNSIKYNSETIRGLVTRKHGMKLTEVKNLFEFFCIDLNEDDYVLSKHYGNKEVILPDEPNEDFCRLLGFMVGDGYIDNSKSRNYTVALCTGYNDDAVYKYVSLFKKVFGIELKNDRSQWYCYSRELYEYLVNIGDFIKYAPEKEIPIWVYRLNKKQKIAFIEGLLDADGCPQTSGNHTQWSIELSSKKLIDGLNILCSEVGIHTVSLRNRERITNYCRKRISSKSYSINTSSTKDDEINDNFRLSKIKGIYYCGKEEVFDIEVEGSHNFIANSIVVHNSMATPSVAGCFALLLQAGMKRDRYAAEDLIGNTAMFQHPKDIYTGWGMINVKKAYDYLVGNKRIVPISSVSRVIDIPLRPLASLIPQSEQSIDSKRIRLPYIR